MSYLNLCLVNNIVIPNTCKLNLYAFVASLLKKSAKRVFEAWHDRRALLTFIWHYQFD